MLSLASFASADTNQLWNGRKPLSICNVFPYYCVGNLVVTVLVACETCSNMRFSLTFEKIFLAVHPLLHMFITAEPSSSLNLHVRAKLRSS